jgi:uncharacterized SAM-binding protein YcdF (DUF218 family)
MRDIFSYFLRPITVLWLLLIISLLLLIRKKTKKGLIFFIISLLWFALISTRFVPELLIRNLESQYQSFQLPDSSCKLLNARIMVLGGGFSDDSTLFPNDQLSTNSLARLIEGIRIQKRLPGSKIVSGGFPGKLTTKQSEVFLKTASSMGVATSDIICLNIQQNTTHGEVDAYVSAFGNESVITILVTDAIHLPRAMMRFKESGLNPIPAPTNHLIKKNSYRNRFSWLPSNDNIYNLELVTHEYIGIAWMKLGGR